MFVTQWIEQGRASVVIVRWFVGLLLFGALMSCGEDTSFTRVFQIETMAQTIGGPAAAARPGDYLMENNRIRAVIHGRHNMRGILPIANGSLMDLDIQRPEHRYGAGKGEDTFYELSPMVNLRVNSSTSIDHGSCMMSGSPATPSVGAAPCPEEGCVRVSAKGKGENIIGLLGLLDLAIERPYQALDLALITDYDLCPDQSVIRITTTAQFQGDANEVLEMEELQQQTGLLSVLLGEHTGSGCITDEDCNPNEKCTGMLVEIKFGDLDTKMRRCRKADQKLAGVLAGDWMFFSAKARVFIDRSGFDHESYIRSVFDTGGDIFSQPLNKPFIAGVSDEVSYVYFNRTGRLMTPVFSESFSASMSNQFACTQQQPDCMAGKQLRFTRFVSVGQGDVASALEGYYTIRGIPTGRIEGHVIDARTQGPVSGAEIFAYQLPQTWMAFSDEMLAQRSFKQLMEDTRSETRTEVNRDGEGGPVSHFKSDVGLDTIPDGSFAGSLPQERYILVVHAEGRAISALVPVKVEAGSTTRVTLVSGDSSILQYAIQDQAGTLIPAKLSIGHCFAECARDQDCPQDRPQCDLATSLCIPHGGYTGSDSCRPDQIWQFDPDQNKETCRCPNTGTIPLTLGGSRLADNTVQVVNAVTGQGQVQIEPGEAAFQVVVSRGYEYEISRQFVHLQPGVTSRIRAILPRVVDTKGWISADFHVHGPNSVDSGLTKTSRVASYATEGVELLTATDHDYLTDYAPVIRQMNLQTWLKSQVGVEVSPLDYGHFIGFPLRFNENEELNGSFHWRVSAPETKPNGDDFESLPSGTIFKKIKELGSLGVDQTVVFIAHFYDHFRYYDLDPWTLEPPLFNIMAMFNDVLARGNFSGEYDALEAFNGKNMDIIRRPTYEEVQAYNQKLAELLEQGEGLSYEERQRRWSALSAEVQARYLHRTKEEQALAIDYQNSDFECRCMADSECGPNSLCDANRATCIPGCSEDTHCDAKLTAAGREACLPLVEDASRKTCQRVPAACQDDTECSFAWDDKGEKLEHCLAVDGKVPELKSCELACTEDSACNVDPLRPVCDLVQGVCIPVLYAQVTGIDPCPTVSGTVDDWFQMLNRGVHRSILGNSDSHTTYSTEAGVPRNYVMSDTDAPRSIQVQDVASHIKAGKSFTTYGPFVEMTLNDQPLGSVVASAAGQPVQLKIRVQSPRWFDVDRIEIYSNGQLIHEINGSTACPPSDQSCIKVPNDTVVNYEGVFTHTPDRDAWYVIAVMGLEGKSMAPVYSSTPVPRLGMFELIQRLTPLLPPLRSFRTPLSPSMTTVRPYAITNPIWVDVGGDGKLESVQPQPSWATEQDALMSSQKSALTFTSDPRADPGEAHANPDAHEDEYHGHQAEGHVHGELPHIRPRADHHHQQSHDHRRGLGRLQDQAREFQRELYGAPLTRENIQRAFDNLKELTF